MHFLNDTGGTALFPIQTEIAFVLSIFTTAKDLALRAWSLIRKKEYRRACLCILLLVAYVGLTAGVVWAVIPWLKAFCLAKIAVSPCWFTPVKSLMLWGIGRMVAATCRKITLLK